MRLVWRETFAVDPRSLAAFRIAISLVLLADLGIRAADLEAMYTDGGLFPRALICRHYSIWTWSFHFGAGSWQFQAGLFGLAGACALALLAGWQTRAATVASWLLLVSLHNRVPVVLSGADNLLRMLLFWGMFLPLGKVGSLDARRQGRADAARTSMDPIKSVASAAVLIQMALVYLCSAAFKSNEAWLGGGAGAAILADGFYGKPAGARLLAFPGALPAASAGVVVLEWLGPFLLLAPVASGWLRVAALALLASMHIGIELFLNVGLFSYVSLAGLVLFVPAPVWSWLRRREGGNSSGERTSGLAIAPGPRSSAGSRVARAACGLALAYAIFESASSLAAGVRSRAPAPGMELLTVGLGLGQTWDMFSRPPPRNGWCAAIATLEDGSQVDVLRGGAPAAWERPADPASVYPNHRWLKLFRELALAETRGIEVMRRPVAEYLGRRWNAAHAPGRQAVAIALVFCTQRTNELGPRTVRETLAHVELGPRGR